MHTTPQHLVPPVFLELMDPHTAVGVAARAELAAGQALEGLELVSKWLQAVALTTILAGARGHWAVATPVSFSPPLEDPPQHEMLGCWGSGLPINQLAGCSRTTRSKAGSVGGAACPQPLPLGQSTPSRAASGDSWAPGGWTCCWPRT